MAGKDHSIHQLEEYLKTPEGAKKQQLTQLEGRPVGDKTNSVTAGPRGPLCLADTVFVEEMAHFDRERIPERVVHAKGAAGFGTFEVTKPDIQKYSKAALFNKVGKQTPMALRFSTVGGESGSADTVRDPRGFALKFYTEEGNWDLVGNNTPIFFLRDPILFPSFIHTQKRNPQTHCKDPNMFWDFITLRPETTHQVCFLFSDRGIPDGFRHMHGFGSHTFKLVNKDNEAFYCKFHMRTQQGIKNLTVEKAHQLSADDPDYSLRDLYNAIATGDFPKWTMHIQVMSYAEATKVNFNPFDVTKVWSQKDYPLIEVGTLTLNRNAVNYFAEVEQLAFCPNNFVPGIEASPDKMLQGRIFSYADTTRHRLGPNFHQIPVNRPRCPIMNPTMRDGVMAVDGNGGNAPNYFPNSFSKMGTGSEYLEHHDHVTGDVARHESGNDDNFSQVTTFWEKTLKADERQRLVSNIAGHLKDAAGFIQERAVKNFRQVHPDFGAQLATALEKYSQVSHGTELIHKFTQKFFSKANSKHS